MSSSTNTYTKDIETVVKKRADELNKGHEDLANDYTGEFGRFFADICLENRIANNAKATVVSARRTMPRVSFQKILSSLEERSQNKKSAAVVDEMYHLHQYTLSTDFPYSFFYFGKAVIAHDAVIHILRAIWEHAPVAQKAFKEVVAATCVYVPPHMVSRFLLLVHPPIIQPIPEAEKVVIGRSTFGHTVVGESYLRRMTPRLIPPPSDSAMSPSQHAPRDDTLTALSVPPSTTISVDSVSPSLDATTSAPLNISNTGKRKYWFQEVISFKRIKVDNGEARSASVVDEETATSQDHDDGTGTASAGAARGTMPGRPVRKLPRSRRGCPFAPLLDYSYWYKTE